jgi:RNA polymerase sigma-70 factor (ECF subfamily)
MSDTQDLVQEVLLQTFKQITTFEPRREGALQAYLRQAIRNRIVDELRRAERRPEAVALDSGQPDVKASPLEAAIGSEAADRYERALSVLRPEDREAIVGRVELGLSYDELADALEKPSADAARKAARRALLKLTEALQNER